MEGVKEMKVGIIADTHDNLDAIAKAVKVFNDEGIKLLIHAGDFIAPFTSQPFKQLKAPLVGVFGNNDGDKLLLKKFYKENGVGELYQDPYEFDVGTKKVMVTHTPAIVGPIAASGRYDAVIYGHTHKVVIGRQRTVGGGRGEKTWILNPGECCGYLTGRQTVVILDFEKEEAELVEL